MVIEGKESGRHRLLLFFLLLLLGLAGRGDGQAHEDVGTQPGDHRIEVVLTAAGIEDLLAVFLGRHHRDTRSVLHPDPVDTTGDDDADAGHLGRVGAEAADGRAAIHVDTPSHVFGTAVGTGDQGEVLPGEDVPRGNGHTGGTFVEAPIFGSGVLMRGEHGAGLGRSPDSGSCGEGSFGSDLSFGLFGGLEGFGLDLAGGGRRDLVECLGGLVECDFLRSHDKRG